VISGAPAKTFGLGPSLLLRIVPILICLGVFWNGIRCWFVQDDFAWLGLSLQVHSFGDLLYTLFSPKAQGTIRPLSERVYFMGLFELFGMDALPFRIVAFATQAINLWLLGSIAHKLTRSRVAAFCAPLLWGVNPGLSVPMSWTSSYNQLLCAACLMGAFRLFLQWIDTGDRRFYVAQWAIFLLGFGALELNVVYPALAGAYALLASRRHFVSTLPLGAISAVYTLVHNYYAPKVQTGPYAMHLDGSMVETLLRYWLASFGWHALRDYGSGELLRQITVVMPWIFTAALLGYLGFQLARREWAALFPLAWFVIVIGPVLPLRDHFSEYYLTSPTIGIALAGASALAVAAQRRGVALAAATTMGVAYLAGAIPASRWISTYHMQRSKAVRDLVWSVERINQLHPGKMILLHNVDSGTFWAGFHDDPFRLLGLTEVYLTPESTASIPEIPELGDVNERILPELAVLRSLERGQAVVYAASSYPLRNITRRYQQALAARGRPGQANRVNVGRQMFDEQLGGGWYPIENGYRWMGRRAVVRVGRPPRLSSGRLQIDGYCPSEQLEKGPLQLRVTAAGVVLPSMEIARPDHFEYVAPFTAGQAGEVVEVVIEVSRTIRRNGREEGLAFGKFAYVK
jgi:hypothetical protein